MAEYVVLVDSDDNPLGLEEKTRCHLPDGKLHRAFTAILFDRMGRVLLAKRSAGKMLWPGVWDGTVASHPRKSESYVDSGIRRMPEELGLSCTMKYLFKFEYHVPYKDIGSENEICAVLAGVIDSEPHPVLDEISAVRWIAPGELVREADSDPGSFCPWMLAALYLFSIDDESIKKCGLSGDWAASNLQDTLKAAVKKHMPNNSWRLLHG